MTFLWMLFTINITDSVCLQRDVTGECDVAYTVTHQGWKSRTLSRVKDMTSCTNRQAFDSAVQTAPFRLSSVSF